MRELVALLLSDLGVTKTHSRPHTSNDNPYSEAQFKTLKYRPDFPERFGSLEDARAFCKDFFTWYNLEHHHSGIGLMTPQVVHYGLAQDVFRAREKVLLTARVCRAEGPGKDSHGFCRRLLVISSGRVKGSGRAGRRAGRRNWTGLNVEAGHVVMVSHVFQLGLKF